MSVCDKSEAESSSGYDMFMKKLSVQWAVLWSHANQQWWGIATGLPKRFIIGLLLSQVSDKRGSICVFIGKDLIFVQQRIALVYYLKFILIPVLYNVEFACYVTLDGRGCQIQYNSIKNIIHYSVILQVIVGINEPRQLLTFFYLYM